MSPTNPLLVCHEVTKLFPRARGEARAQLKASIAALGVKEPVKVVCWPRGKLLIDGVDRREIADELGIVCPEVEYRVTEADGSTRPPTDAEVLDYVMVANCERRSHTSSQLAAIAVLAGFLQRKYHKRDWSRWADAEGDQGAVLAAQNHTTRAYLFAAAAVYRKSPALLRRVAHGELSLERARDQSGQVLDKNEELELRPEPSPVPDELGQPVPNICTEVFALRSVFDEVQLDLKRARRALRQLATHEASAFLDLSSAVSLLRQVSSLVRDARPHAATCPACQGTGRVMQSNLMIDACEACAGHGWCGLLAYQEALRLGLAGEGDEPTTP